jgi:nitric oxide reductase large subunit
MSNMDNTSYYTRDYEYQPQQYSDQQDENQLMPILVLVLLGLGIGTVIALIAAQNRKPKRTDLIGQIEDRLNGVEKELNKFGKRLEQRVKEMQR